MEIAAPRGDRVRPRSRDRWYGNGGWRRCLLTAHALLVLDGRILVQQPVALILTGEGCRNASVADAMSIGLPWAAGTRRQQNDDEHSAERHADRARLEPA